MAFVCCALGVLVSLPTAAWAEKWEYNRDVRPILADFCFACHGPDSAARKADLRLDQRDAALSMKAIVPGQPDQSSIIERILSKDPDAVMPPPATKKSLSARQRQILAEWIREGAEYQPHWSFIPPTKPEPPTVKQTAWVRNPIDRFVLAALEQKGLAPAPQADRRILARRVSLDLTGLPPKPEQVLAFVLDSSPDAYEKYVDSLLKSPQWGEHRGRYWLDAARYADTHGIHFDNYREIWAYRDWVIDAFNRNLPFDQFTIEQLAGDLLPEATLSQHVASGFNRCNITTNEGGIIDEEYLVMYTRDRTETTAQVWMGLTANCATCHDHKFDPLSQREFYEMAAFFNNTTQPARDGNIKDSPPIRVVPLAEDRARFSELDRLVAAAKSAVEARSKSARPEFDQWLVTATPESVSGSLPTTGLALHLPADDAGDSLTVKTPAGASSVPVQGKVDWPVGHTREKGLTFVGSGVAQVDAAGDFERDQPFSVGVWIKLAANDSSGAILARMDEGNHYRGWDFWVEGRKIGMHIIHQWQDNALKVVAQAPVKGNEWTHVQVTYDGSSKASGVKIYYNGKLQKNAVQADKLRDSIRTTVPLTLGRRYPGSPLTGCTINDLRVHDRVLTEAEVTALANSSRLAALLEKPAAKRTQAETDELFKWWLPALDAGYQAAAKDLETLEKEQAAIKSRGTIAHVMSERTEPPMAFVLFRGEYDKRRDPVSAKTPAVLPPFPTEAPRNRLGFAKWLLLPEHPLTARVTVNRFWQEVFGQGLVRTSGDFGIAGELPSHPELLDWLAVDFRESGWDVRRFFKQLVMSATYQQAALATAAKVELDPSNRWLARGPRFRMDAEMVRDSALAASGLLVDRIGGPSVKPYQPDGVWEAVAMIGSNTRNYTVDQGPNLYRRSLYTFWKRSAPPASMEIFNAPAREVCTVRRERTNTPLQALVTLNDPQFVEAAKVLAGQALKSTAADDEARLDLITTRLVSRTFQPAERVVAMRSLAQLHAFYRDRPDEAKALLATGATPADASLDPGTLAAWTMLCNQLMNLDEVLNK